MDKTHVVTTSSNNNNNNHDVQGLKEINPATQSTNNNHRKDIKNHNHHTNSSRKSNSITVPIQITSNSTALDDNSLTSGAGSSFGSSSSSSTNTGSTVVSLRKNGNKGQARNKKCPITTTASVHGHEASGGAAVSSDSSGEGSSCESSDDGSDISSDHEAGGSDDDGDSGDDGDEDGIPGRNTKPGQANGKIHDVQDNVLMITETSSTASAIHILAEAVERIKKSPLPSKKSILKRPSTSNGSSPPSSSGHPRAMIEVNRLGHDGNEYVGDVITEHDEARTRRATIVLARPPTLAGHQRRGTNFGRGVWPPPMYGGSSTRNSSSSCSSSSVDNICMVSPKSYNFSYRRQSMPVARRDSRNLSKKLNKEPSKKVILFCLSLVNLTAYLTMSIIAPFFPYEASIKGMRESAAGFVFSVYALVMMIASPLLGKVLPVVGVKFMLLSGIWFAGWSNILFGYLDQIEDPMAFSVLCFVVRSVGAFGAASFSTASYTYIIQLFPDNVGLAFGLTETCVGIGMSLGPAVGGLLYGLGGYSLPFYVLGSFILATGPLCAYFVTSIEAPTGTFTKSDYYVESSIESGEKDEMSSSYWNVLQSPKVLVICLVLATATSTQGFLDPTIEPHFRKYGIEPQYVGLVFLTMSAAYAVSSPISGWFAGKIENKAPLMIIGLIVTAIGYVVLGPSEFLNLPPSFWLSSVAMLILGLAYSLAFIPTFETILEAAVARGLPDDVRTYSLVSGLWSCVNSFGEVAGAGLGGIFTEYYGFTFGANCVAFWTLAVAVILFLSYILELIFPSCWSGAGSKQRNFDDHSVSYSSSHVSSSKLKGRNKDSEKTHLLFMDQEKLRNGMKPDQQHQYLHDGTILYKENEFLRTIP